MFSHYEQKTSYSVISKLLGNTITLAFVDENDLQVFLVKDATLKLL